MRAAGKFARLLFVSGMLSNSKEDAKDMSKLDVRLSYLGLGIDSKCTHDRTGHRFFLTTTLLSVIYLEIKFSLAH